MNGQSFQLLQRRASAAAAIVADAVVTWRPWLEREDLVQEGLARIYEAVRRNAIEYQRRAWGEQFAYMTVVARSACSDLYKRTRRHYDARDEEERWTDPSPSPETIALANERTEALLDTYLAAYAQMSAREREVIEHWLGIGPRPDVAKSTYYTYRDRALDKLRQAAAWREW